MITSSGNAQIKHIARLIRQPSARREEGLFVAEGRRLVGEIPRGWIEMAYASEGFLSDGGAAILGGAPLEEVSDSVFKGVSDTKSPQGVLALVRSPSYGEDDLLRGESPLILAIEGVQDPGNLGAMFRSGEAAGATGILLGRGTADPLGPKAVRGTMGSVFRVPFVIEDDLEGALLRLRGRGVRFYAAAVGGSVPYDSPSYIGPCGFLIGNEGSGLTEAALDAADERVCIPMEGSVESLNAAVSASILLFEAARQRRQRPI